MSVNPLTIVTRIRAERLASLGTLLTGLGKRLEDNPYISFSDIRSMHSAAFVIIAGDSEYPPTLVLDINYDGRLDHHLDELIANGRSGIHAIYRNCEGYPDEGFENDRQLRGYLRDHAVAESAYFAAFPDHSVGNLRNAAAIRDQIERFLDEQQKSGQAARLSPAEIRQAIRAHLAKGSPATPQMSPVSLAREKTIGDRNAMLIAGAGLLIAAPLLPLLIAWMLAIRVREQAEARAAQPSPSPIDDRIFAVEDIWIQNHLATVGKVKADPIRQWTLRLVLTIVNLVWRNVFRSGGFGSVLTVHFARGVLLDHGRRFMLLTCYDGSFINYLSDFADKAAYYLNAGYSSVEGYPPTQWLVLGGTAHLQGYALWTRQHMQYTPVFYTAYPNDTVQNLLKDIAIRDSFAARRDRSGGERRTEDLLRML